MARALRGFGGWALLLAVILLGIAAWWLFVRQPTAPIVPPPSPIPEAVSKIPGLLQQEVAALRGENDRLADGLVQAEALLKGDVCDPKRQAELETLLQKIEFAAQLETPPLNRAKAAEISPVSFAPPDGERALPNDELVKQLRAQTVFILAPIGGRDVMLGSGMVIAPGLVLTNRHVVAGSVGRDLVVMASSLADPLLGRVKVLSSEAPGNAGANYSDDFALITVNGPLSAPLLRMADGVQPLDRVVAAGFPTNVITADKQFQDLQAGRAVGMPQVVLSRGDIRVVENQDGPTPVVAHTAEISEGNSGGPLVNTCGQLVGINTFGIRVPGGSRSSGFALGNAAINRFLKSQNVALETGESCAAERL
jgi:serine protease Do